MQTPFDEQLFSRIRTLNARVPRKLVPNNYRSIRTAFLDDSTAALAFRYDLVFDHTTELEIAKLEALAKDIETDTIVHPVVQELYRRKLHEKRTQFQLLQRVAHAQENGTTKEDQEDIQVLCEEIYGKPSMAVFNQLLRQLKRELDSSSEQLDHIFASAGASDVSDLTNIAPSFDGNTPIEDAAYVCERFTEALQLRGIPDWTVEINDEHVSGFKVRPGTRQIFVPSSSVLRTRSLERPFTERALLGLIAHEIETHVVRKENGLRSPLKLLSIGLDKYLLGEEGIATYREQQIAGAEDYAGALLYFAVGLAYGLDQEGVRRSFQETFEILAEYFAVRYRYAPAESARRAFTLCAQIYKGTNERYPGLIFTRACAYREGNIRIHRLLESDPQAIRYFDIGKFDPANDTHMHELRTLGIL